MISAAANAIPQASFALGNKLYYGSQNLLVLWDLDLGTLVCLRSLEGSISAITSDFDGHSLLIGTDRGKIYLFSEDNLTCLSQVPRAVTSLCSNPSTQQMAVSSLDGYVYVYQHHESQPAQSIKVKGYALCSAFCESLLCVGGTSNQILVYELETGAEIYLAGHENWIRSLDFRKDGSESWLLASASQERYVRLWRFNVTSSTSTDLFSTSQLLGKWSIAFEALLIGHDDWVVSAEWDPHGINRLLSASADSSLIIWESENAELWTPSHRLGDISIWGASTATGTSGGFWRALWLDKSIATCTRTGSWRLWNRDTWKASPGITGHFRDVTDVAWFRDNILLSTSLDQTTRLWSVDPSECAQNIDLPLREIGRPQIHGYDMVAIASISETQFVSAGDEKVLRVFELPQQVADQIALISGTQQSAFKNLPQVAGATALGLSNKSEPDGEEPVVLPENPREDHLQRLTLWPEADKLYGHGYEISSLAVSTKLGIVISCCKSNSEKHAGLRYCSVNNWHEISPPTFGHSSTVTSLIVSPNGEHILSVSRDRKFMVVDIASHNIILDMPKAHSRIIWDGCWCSDTEFVTVSRDKIVKYWTINGAMVRSANVVSPATAVDHQNGLIVVGEESGKISFFNKQLELIHSQQFAGRINRLSLRGTLLAVASELIFSVITVPL